jgi:glycosyltransferase involved in cell wall biosynthesis
MNTPVTPVLGIILKGYPRISETFISNEILLLEKLGFKIHLFSMRHPREPFCHESVTKIKATVDYLPESFLAHVPRLLFHNLMQLGKRPRDYARTFKTALKRLLRNKRPATIKHMLQAGILVDRLLPGSGVTHLHAHFAHSPTSVAMFASRLCGIPFSFTAHAKDIFTSDPRQLREKLLLARFVVTCTEYNRRYLMGLTDGEQVPIHRIYHGIDLDLFSGYGKEGALSSPYQIITVARITKKKGLHTVYKALRHLVDQGFPVRHTLIGDGDDRRQILALIEELGLKPVTQWLGTQPHRVVLDHYSKADLFVLGCEVAPNGDRDGIPNVFLESMAMGVPVVATTVSAIPELIENETTGLLVPPGEPLKMAEAMSRLLTERSLRERIIIQGRDRIIRDFNNKDLINELAALYKREGFVGSSGIYR